MSNINEKILKDVIENIQKVRPKYLSILVWTLAKSKQKNAEIFAKSSNHLGPILKEAEIILQPKNEIAQTSNTNQLEKHEESSEEIESESFSEEVEDTNEQNSTLSDKQVELRSLCLIIWGFGKCNMLDDDLFKLFCERLREGDLIEKMSFKMICEVLYSFSQVGFFEKKVYLS